MARQVNIFNNPYYQQLAQSQGLVNENGGLTASGVGSAGMSLLQGAAQFGSALASSPVNINTAAPSQQFYGGRPVYNLGQSLSAASGFNKQDYGRGLAVQGGLTGLQIGMNPALFGVTGGLSAPIGAVVGAIGGGIATRVKRDKAERLQNQRVTNIRAAQQDYNRASQDYTQGYLARQRYEQQFR